jgi:hypothetical protein
LLGEFEFRTYGPFSLEREQSIISRDALEEFWNEVEENAKGLGEAVGVYVISIRNKSSAIPWYVGKTDRGFRKRFAQRAGHSKLFSKLQSEVPRGTVEIHLLARMTAKRKAFKGPGKQKLRSTDRLEELLIGTCYSKNRKLLNLQKMMFHKRMRVPGYLNDSQGKPNEAALSLRSLLF